MESSAVPLCVHADAPTELISTRALTRSGNPWAKAIATAPPKE